MIITIFLGLVILSLALVFTIIFRHIPSIALVGDGELRRFSRVIPFYRKFIKVVYSQQKVITIKLLSKLVRRLKVISLRADNMATKLLVKLRRYSD